MSFLFVLLAALGLGLLVFIHELGHYFAAKWVGIRVEAFSIGFGKPIISWMRGDVQWRIGWLPFGGYVRMAGMDKQEGKQPWEVEGGFFAARPIDRIKVALAGPIVNLVFAFLIFSAIWASGGRDKPFSDLTHRVGWVDTQSELYQEGLRPGDLITAYDGKPFKTSQDHLYAPMLGGETIDVEGFHVDPETGKRTPFDIRAKTYPHPLALEDGLLTLGILSPAQYLLYESGSEILQPGDRIAWADGQYLFSKAQLMEILNDGKAFLVIERNGVQKSLRVPRIAISNLMLDTDMYDELTDWHYSSHLSTKFPQTLFIPYNVSPTGVIETPIPLIDGETTYDLQPDDRIVSVDGTPITTGTSLIDRLQERQVSLGIQRKAFPIVPWEEADQTFDRELQGELIYLKPITPMLYKDVPMAEEQFAAMRSEIEAISDQQAREEALAQLNSMGNQWVLGVNLSDRLVSYNPLPTTQFASTVVETGRTLKALFTGSLSPKFLSGPVGIVQVMHYGWTVGIKEALFWLSVISLNLGLLNLLPVPVLDGGHIIFSLWEMITKKRIKSETMAKLVIPFVILLIGFFVFATYQDLSRLFRGFF